METSSQPSGKDQYLKSLNKLSHKISKPPSFHRNPPPPPPPQDFIPPPIQHQPPVYNISKSDFRDVVQKLTGSPSQTHSTPSPPRPKSQQQPNSSSRLQRIRPPPLAQLSTRLSSLLSSASNAIQSTTPFSPLPPFPGVHVAAESPVSAYLRRIKSCAVPSTLSTAAVEESATRSPRGGHPDGTVLPLQSVTNIVSTTPMPTSPLAMGCGFPSPRSPYPLPLSPSTLSVPSPRWRDL